MAFVKLSPTKVATWLDCPRRFFFTYVERQRSGEQWAHFSFGSSVHAALRTWFDFPAQERSRSSVDGLVASVWIDSGYRDREQSNLWRDYAARIVGDYVELLPADFEPVSTERTLAFKSDSFIVEGRIDRLDQRGTGLSVVDYKTGKAAPTHEDVRGSQALAMYALMVQRALGESCFEVALHHVPTRTEVSWTHTPESLARQLTRVTEIAEDIIRAQDTWESIDRGEALIRDEIFPARPNSLCGYCDFWQVCSTGQAFMAQKKPWDGLNASTI